MFPVPLAARPIPVLVLVQLNVSAPPVLALKLMAGTVAPEHATTMGITATTGSALMVIVNVLAFAPALVQPLYVAVTIMLPATSAPEILIGAVYVDIFPNPPEGRPIAVFVLVQIKDSPPPVLAEKLIPGTGAPEHTETFGMTATTGSGLMVIVKVFMFPGVEEQPFLVAETVTVPTMSDPVVLTVAV